LIYQSKLNVFISSVTPLEKALLASSLKIKKGKPTFFAPSGE
jgi:hypothetical protein